MDKTIKYVILMIMMFFSKTTQHLPPSTTVSSPVKGPGVEHAESTLSKNEKTMIQANCSYTDVLSHS